MLLKYMVLNFVVFENRKIDLASDIRNISKFSSYYGLDNSKASKLFD